MIHHALLRQTEVILNSMDNIVARVVKIVLAGEYNQDIGPAINPHVGEKRFYTRPLQIPQKPSSFSTHHKISMIGQPVMTTRLLSYRRCTSVSSGTGPYVQAKNLTVGNSRSRSPAPTPMRLPVGRSLPIKS